MSVLPNDADRARRRALATDFAAIAALWGLSLLIVNPVGEFPLNDDWSYGLTVRHLLEAGDYRPQGWAAMPLITNVLWGALFCLPGGFSFTALRVSTLTLSLAGMLGVYALVRDLRQPRRLARLTALTVGFNPIFLALSCTFMTDVPCAALMFVSAYALGRHLRGGSLLELGIGTVLSVGATLSRQTAVCVPLAFALSMVVRHGLLTKAALRAAVPGICCLMALIGFPEWLEATGRLPALYHSKTDSLRLVLTNPRALLENVASNSFVAIHYLGLFLLPVLAALWPGVWRGHRSGAMVCLAGANLAMAACYGVRGGLQQPVLMPLSENVLTGSGIGPLTLRDAFILQWDPVPALPVTFWWGVTVLSVVGAVGQVALLAWGMYRLARRHLASRRISDREATALFHLFAACLNLAPVVMTGLFDRYLIPVLPFVAAGILGLVGRAPREASPGLLLAVSASGRRISDGWQRGRRLAVPRGWSLLSPLLLASLSLFAVGTTHDYLAWNRARWTGLRRLMEVDRIPPAMIDGGFEFNGLYGYDPRLRTDPRFSWWWVRDDTYLVSFGHVPGYVVMHTDPYLRYIPPRRGAIVSLKKAPPPADGSDRPGSSRSTRQPDL